MKSLSLLDALSSLSAARCLLADGADGGVGPSPLAAVPDRGAAATDAIQRQRATNRTHVPCRRTTRTELRADDVLSLPPIRRRPRATSPASDVVDGTAPPADAVSCQVDGSANQCQGQDLEDAAVFLPGTVVELHGDASYFAVPALVVSVRREDDPGSHAARDDARSCSARGAADDDDAPGDPSLIRYDLHSPLHGSRPTGVEARFVHPYRPYDAGTAAHCDLGGRRPCTVESHVARADGRVSYRVRYAGQGGEVEEAHLPFERVQRVLGAR